MRESDFTAERDEGAVPTGSRAALGPRVAGRLSIRTLNSVDVVIEGTACEVAGLVTEALTGDWTGT